ncbi:MAG: O-antigen ligase family protein [Microlunatus sp.]|nr:O-antigen ligase family protein [Microlunatus sp.]MDN5778306.1 O-antigen ligase family protein [Humibacillus sp.]
MSSAVTSGRLTLKTEARAGDTGQLGAVLAIGTCVVSCLLSAVGAGSLIQIAFPAVMVALAMILLLRRAWYSSLSFTLVTWLLASEVRRFADWHTYFHAVSLISVTPALVSLVALPWALAGRRLVYRDVATLMAITFIVMGASFAVGVLRNGVGAALVDVLYLVAPATTGVFVLTVPSDRDRLKAILRYGALVGTAALSAYAILQFLVLPPWDEAWITASEVSNIGLAEPGAFRAFSTLSTTGPLGQVLAVLLLLLIAERRPGRQVIVFVFGLTALGITLVRAGWIGLALGAVVLLLLGRVKVWRLAAALTVMVLAIMTLGGPILERVADRANETATSGTADTSFSARLSFQSEIAPAALSDPVGKGFGATGRGTEFSGLAAVDPKFRNFDSGIFETLTRYGSVGGLLLLGALSVAVFGILMRARRGTTLDATVAAGIFALWAGLIFTDTLRAVYGVLLWSLIGFAGRVDRTNVDDRAGSNVTVS